MGGSHSTEDSDTEEAPIQRFHLTQLKNGPSFPTNRSDSKRYRKLRVVCLSDTHTKHRRLEIPDGDILIHTGDFSNYANWFREQDLHQFNEWLKELPHKHKIIIAGNHDLFIHGKSVDEIQKRLSNATYLQDSSVTVEGIKIYGCPWQSSRSWKYRANAYCVERPDLKKKLDLIPDDVDILMTHCPPYHVLADGGGNIDILRAVGQKRPKVHVFGHVHGGTGIAVGSIDGEEDKEVLFVNAAQQHYKVPMVFDYFIEEPEVTH
eukprot:TRINITY_DN3413_c0_g1_i1.p1 TRINITY_DN3413_c0_g1~~TRINITY_DN3413_c0_g1_i1.p1  ORF type:complete len:263 (-),score=3.71 TRINITY_DN3413_c0_g1_i1:60-848(-)